MFPTVTYVQVPQAQPDMNLMASPVAANSNNMMIPTGQPMIFQLAPAQPYQTTFLTQAPGPSGGPQTAVLPQAIPQTIQQAIPQALSQTISQAIPQTIQQTIAQPSSQTPQQSTPQNPMAFVFDQDADMDHIKATLPAIPSGDKWIRGLTGPNYTVTSLELYDPEEDEKPKYVNPKQFQRILKRRSEREKLIRQGRIPEERAKYLHESRHRHALNRTRLKDGRFHSKS